MKGSPLRAWLLFITMIVLVGTSAVEIIAQTAAPGAVVRITVLDPTGGRLVSAQVTLVDPAGIERSVAVNASGAAVFDGLTPGTYQARATAEGFSTVRMPLVVKRGENQTTMRLAIAGVEQTINVQGESPAQRRDNGFTQTLSADEIDALSDDPDEMAISSRNWPGPALRSTWTAFAADVCRRRHRFNKSGSIPIRTRPSITMPAWCA